MRETICAQATPPGIGGVSVVRVSGAKVKKIAKMVIGNVPKPRYALFSSFLGRSKKVLDHGVALYFPKPHSFTGEDVLELHCHGGPMVMDAVLQRVIELGAQLAAPGEFSKRAFLNGKLDLTQAEAVADLICASSEQAARSAIRSLQGEFSQKIKQVAEKIINLRVYVEAAIDFSEEEIDYISSDEIKKRSNEILKELKTLLANANQGVLLQEGISVVIAGKPNVGKSSILNRFCGENCAIVTNIPGTTRDVLRQYINLDGMPLHIVDTAGLRESIDQIEVEGIKRAWGEIQKADFILFVSDNGKINIKEYEDFLDKAIFIRNKIDLTKYKPHIEKKQGLDVIYLSAKTGQGFDLLKDYLKIKTGFKTAQEGNFIARRRHLIALQKAEKNILQGIKQFKTNQALELLAEDLRRAQNALNEITGEFYTEDLLGKIFSEFCVGK